MQKLANSWVLLRPLEYKTSTTFLSNERKNNKKKREKDRNGDEGGKRKANRANMQPDTETSVGR